MLTTVDPVGKFRHGTPNLSLRRLVEQHVATLAGAVDIRAMVDRHGRLSVNIHGQLDSLPLLCAAQPDRAAELLMASARRANIGRPGDPITEEERRRRLEDLRLKLDAAARAEEAALQREVREGRPGVRRHLDASHILRVLVVPGPGSKPLRAGYQTVAA